MRFYSFFIIALILLNACANISHPTGGKKDVAPPKLVSVFPPDSQLNTRVTRLEMRFDEFVNVNNAASEVQLSPLLAFPPTVEAVNRRVIIKIPDSLLQENTTYRIRLGNAIADVHENNPFVGYNYIFSTGAYFDSLSIGGTVMDAASGMKDTGAYVLLYDASKSDSIVVKEKPSYVVKTEMNGEFRFTGLPAKAFRIFALRDGNNNLVYDGGAEMIAFHDKTIFPKDSIDEPVELYISSESDSVNNSNGTALADGKRPGGRFSREGETVPAAAETPAATEGFTYLVAVDTSDTKKRTREITTPLDIVFNKKIKTINANRINLSYDSLGTLIEAKVVAVQDTMQQNKLQLQTAWKENTVYILRLLKNFAIDSSGTEALPSRHTFRTKSESDYARLHIHLPTKYLGEQYLFVLMKDGKPFYQQPVTDTNIHFYQLQPATYTMRVILDENKNGKWDHGKLFEKRQPEKVIPSYNPINLKPGWENIVDFEQPPAATPNIRSRRPGVAPR
ncbi:MAG TPA: Ig-like domain-containing protein [Flavipsychrobacter sp.]|nr:Ig-like domain-containing protein [Flavipsychrobacter sp.]